MKKLKTSTKWVIAVGILIILVVLYLLALFMPDSIYRNAALYPFWVIECGGRQPVLGSSHGDIHRYYLPGDEGYSPHIFIDTHFCTEEKARAAGFKHVSE